MANAPQTPAVRAFPQETHPLGGAAHVVPNTSSTAFAAASLSERPASFVEAAIGEVIRLAAHEPHLLAIALTQSESLLDAWGGLSDRFFHAHQQPESALRWCRDVAATGAHPLVFVSAEMLREHVSQFRRQLSAMTAGVTLLVQSSSSAISNLATARHFERDEDLDLDLMRLLPCAQVLCPASAAELRQMLVWCVQAGQPAGAIWLPDWPVKAAHSPFTRALEVGRADMLVDGHDAGIVALGPTVELAAAAVAELGSRGVAAAVISARFAHPLDEHAIVELAQHVPRLVIVQAEYDRCGFGRRVIEFITREGLSSKLAVVTIDRTDRNNPRDLFDRCQREIVARCQPAAATARSGYAALNDSEGSSVAASSTGVLSAEWMAEALDEHRRVLGYELSPTVAAWVTRYEEVGKRGVYLWKWCLHGLDLIALPSIAPERKDHLRDTKLLAVMLGVMLDDVADQAVDDAFLKELTKLTYDVQVDFTRFTQSQQEYAHFTAELWTTITARLKTYPRWREYETLLAYDHQQIINAMAYSCLLNRDLCMVNMVEHDAYLPHNMQMMSFATMDLMCSPAFDRRDLGKLREVIWHAQCMGRIGNLVSTWQRELTDRDFSSGVFAHALVQGDVSIDELQTADRANLETVIQRGGHEAYFFRRWSVHRSAICAMQPHIRSLDVQYLIVALERLIRMELASRGFK